MQKLKSPHELKETAALPGSQRNATGNAFPFALPAAAEGLGSRPGA